MFVSRKRLRAIVDENVALKKVVEDLVKDKEKKDIVKNVVKSVEQMYKNLHGTDKLDKAMKNASQMLSEKGINITDLELMTLLKQLCANLTMLSTRQAG